VRGCPPPRSESQTVNSIHILPIGSIDGEVLRFVAQEVVLRFNYRCEIMPGIEEPSSAFEPARMQYSSSKILREILQITRAHPVAKGLIKVLGIADVDLCTPILTFVFGEAQLGGRAALISLHRLHQGYYGLKPDPQLLMERAAKEALHELGHTFGLTHCPEPGCVMYFSNSIRQIDAKSDQFCDSCAVLLAERRRGAGE